uniref:Outer dense fiber protein 3-like protein 2 n=1 Tax=Gouania willdenowi TaxID=441366 RepID=A0A8C5I331_GOUWI
RMEEEVKRRPIISARERGPGPGRYALPPTLGYLHHDFTKPSSPAYSFHSRLSSTMVSVDSSPGPMYHIGEKVTRFGRMETPSYSMLGRGRRSATKVFQTPGPGTYSPERVPPVNGHRTPPSYTIGTRTRYRCVDAVPAPNRYTHLPNLLGCSIPNKVSSSSFSFSSRRKYGAPNEGLSSSPGPGQYDSTNPDVYRHRQPSFTMQSRHRRANKPGSAPSPGSAPGPGSYSPERFYTHLPKAPSTTLGVRHSQFITPLVVDVAD